MLFIRRYCSRFQRIVDITKTPGEKLGIQGWIKTIRRLKNNIFLDVNDGSTKETFQIVIPKSDKTVDISAGSSIRVVGRVQVAPKGHYEIHAVEVEVLAHGHITDGYPFSPKKIHPPEKVREYLHLRSRVDNMASVLRLRHKAQKAIHDVMDEHNFVHINTPIITTNDCEGGGEVFTVQPDSALLLKSMARPNVPQEQSYFDTKVFLSVSGQLHLEAMSYGLGNTYTLSPAFRAENCKSPLHLCEFYMYEAELAFVEDLNVLTYVMESTLKDITRKVIDTSIKDLTNCQQQAQGKPLDLAWLNSPWVTLSYNEALQVVQQNKGKFKTPIIPEVGLSKEQELFLVEYCGAPLFVVDWPAEQKPFYMKVSRKDPRLVHGLDLLMPNVGELCGGGVREYDVERLRQHLKYPKDLDWYLDIRKYGGIPTAGFGMGFERYLQLLTGVKNIRDVIPFPRYAHNCKM